MRLLHTADWHLGRTFHQTSLLPDQEYVLEQLIALARETRPDAVIVAGDLYDRALPPADAVRLLSWTLEELALGLETPVLLIAGNHDSAERVHFASTLLSRSGLHIRGALDADLRPVILEDAHGPVSLCLLPYAEPPLVREILSDPALHAHDAAMAALTARIRARVATDRSVLVAHCFATGGEESESERPLTIGGAGNVETARFRGFHYTALGHLHRPQSLERSVRYSGSLLKYSFSEAEHEKSVSLVEMDGAGEVRVEVIPLTPRRDVRIVEGSLDDLRARPGDHGPVDDFLLVRLTDRKAILDAMGKLRQVFPNVLHLEQPAVFRGGDVEVAGRERLKESEGELFGSFFREMTGADLSEEESRAFQETVDELHRTEREVTA
jgi:exonuclease SbcD